MVNAQEWLDQNYPLENICIRKEEGYDGHAKNYGKTRSEITELDISDQNLDGELVLTDFVDLETIYLSNNQITSLEIVNCPHLNRIWANNNFITKIESLLTNLTSLVLTDNQLVSDLNQFSQLINLERLDIGSGYAYSLNHDFLDFEEKKKLSIERINRGSYNQFTGSLASLKNLTKLKRLDISNTDLNDGVEYLPSSLIELHYDTRLRPYCRLKEIEKELDQFKNNRKNYLQSKIKENEQKVQFFNDRLNQYLQIIKPKLEKKLGEGGFAVVYQGLWRGNPVAIKCSKFSASSMTEKELEIFEQEVNFLKKLNNPYIILYIDIFKDEWDLMVMTELAYHGSLTDYIKNHKDKEYDWKTNYNFIKQISLGLSYLHHSNIIHCDLKSMNILICEGNIAKIADFGISRTIDNLTISKTASKGVSGTTRWMAPELLTKNRQHTIYSDIYALGMIFWEISAKKTVPFDYANNNVDVLMCHLRGEKEEIPTETPEPLKTIIKECWKEKPMERITLAEIEQKINAELQKENKLEAQIEIPPK